MYLIAQESHEVNREKPVAVRSVLIILGCVAVRSSESAPKAGWLHSGLVSITLSR